jgi:hypothetical protein
MSRPVFSFWTGGRPSRLAYASIRSFVTLGHPYTLYAYDEVKGLPDGVRVADAEPILPRRKVAYLLERRAYTLVANRFRYARLRSGGLWVDADLIALRALDFADDDIVFGWQDAGSINVAVLGAPAGHPLIEDLDRVSRAFRLWYPWVEPRPPRRERLRRIGGSVLKGRAFSLAAAPWGVTGPNLITELAQKHGLTGEAREQSAFYPIPWQDAHFLLDPHRGTDALITPGTYTVHVWNSILRRKGIDVPPTGSLLERLTMPRAA